MKPLDRVKSWLGMSPRPEAGLAGQFWGFGELGGAYPIESLGDGWQRNLTIDGAGARHIPAVFACVMRSADAVAVCYPHHRVTQPGGGYSTSTTSPAYRFFRKPNSYQTWPQFIRNLVATMLFDGEAFCQIVRDNRYVVTGMHLLQRGSCSPFVAEDGSIFYSVGTNIMDPAQTAYVAPQREIAHFRMHTPRHPLIGESPIRAAALACGVNVALSRSQAAFFSHMSRPSGVLTTDQALTAVQMSQLREAFDRQAAGWAQGKLPILAAGLKFQQLSINSQDAQLIEAQRMSVEDIARVFGVPLPIIGDLSHATLNNTESLINHWLAISLGSMLENLERSFDDALGISDGEFIEFDTKALLRLDYQGRIEALAKATSSGILAPNEARLMEGLPPVEGGDDPFMQAQQTPVNLLAELAASNIAAKNKPEPAPEPTPAAPAAEPAPAEEAKAIDLDVTNALLASIFTKARSNA